MSLYIFSLCKNLSIFISILYSFQSKPEKYLCVLKRNTADRRERKILLWMLQSLAAQMFSCNPT